MAPEKAQDIEQARQNGAQDARIEILLTQAGQLFDLHRDLMNNGLPQCRVQMQRIAAVETSIGDLSRLVQRLTLGLTILWCAVFGAEKVAAWVRGKSDTKDTASAVSVDTEGRINTMLGNILRHDNDSQ